MGKLKENIRELKTSAEDFENEIESGQTKQQLLQ